MARGVTLNATISARDAASKNINRVNKSLTGLGNTAKQIGSDFKRVALFTAGLATAAAAFTAVAIKGAVADAAAQAKMMAVLKARGLATESVTAAIEAQIAAAAKLGFTDDEVRASVEAATRFTKDYSVAQKIQTVAMDLSRATGMSLADATLQVGKAYTGTGAKLFKVLGITKQNIKGQKALDAILSKTGGTAEAYGKTAEGAFSALSIQAAELQESFGAAFLPAVTKLFIGLQPHLERFGNYIKAATPTIEKFTTELVDKFLEKLPGWIAAAEEKFPSLLRQIGKFVDDIKGVGKAADGLLGPGGSITLLVTGIGAAFGGLRGAIATNLLKGGVDPIKAYFISTVGAGVLQGVTDGLTKSLTSAAVTKFMALFKNIPVSVAPTGPGAPGVPVPVKPGAPAVPPVVPAAGGLAGLATLAAGLTAAAAIPTAIVVGIQQLLVGGAKEDERRRNNWTEDQQKLFYQILREQQAGMTSFEIKQKYGESIANWVTENLYRLNNITPPSSGTFIDPMTQRYGLPDVAVTVNIGDKKVDTVVGDSVRRLGVPGAPNKY
jgi:hypothetical protein